MSEITTETGDNEGTSTMFTSVWVKVEIDDTPIPEDEPEFPEDLRENNALEDTPDKSVRIPNRRKYKCDKCDYTSAYKHCIKLHQHHHTENKDFKCDECNYETKHSSALQRHVRMKHRPDSPSAKSFRCVHCDYKTCYKGNLRAHSRKHIVDKPFKCDQCPYETAYYHNYMKHEKVHNQESPLTCKECGFTTKYEGHLRRHLKMIHCHTFDARFKCDFCPYSTNNKWRMTKHMGRESKNSVLIQCHRCEHLALNKCALAKHCREHGSDVKPPNQEYVLHRHYKRRLVSQSYKCHFCEFSTLLRTEIETHENGHFANAEIIPTVPKVEHDKRFKCDECPYASRFKASVERHYVRWHTETVRAHKCTQCGFATKTKDQLALHMKRSSVTTPLVCNECNYTTVHKCQLSQHMRQHFVYQCDTCQYSCKKQGDLVKHVSTHENKREFKCRFCEFVSIRKHTVLCHESLHTGIKPFKCRVCDYSATRKNAVVEHERKHLNLSQ